MALLLICLAIAMARFVGPNGAPGPGEQLLAAVSGGDAALAERILKLQPELLETRDGEHLTPLSLAAIRGDAAMVRRLIERGAELETIGVYGETPSIKAAGMGHGAAVSTLLSLGAEVDHRGNGSDTALMLAATRGHLSIVKALVEHGADVHYTTAATEESVLARAAAYGHRGIVDLLLAQGGKINHRDAAGCSVLQYASDDRIYQQLVEAGVPTGPAEMFREGYKLALAGRYAEAAEQCKQATQNDTCTHSSLHANLYDWKYAVPSAALTLPIMQADSAARSGDTAQAGRLITESSLPWPDAARAVLFERRQDVVQEVFASIARGIVSFRREKEQGSFRSWLATITRNCVRDHFRWQATREAAAGGTEALRRLEQHADSINSTITSDTAMAPVVRRVLESVRAEFEASTWTAFWMTGVEGRRVAEVAEAIGMSVASVYQAKSRILKRLRQRLSELPD